MPLVKITVFSGARSEFGFLKCLVEKLEEATDVTCRLLVSGMHLDARSGLTLEEISESGFQIVTTRPVVPKLESESFVAEYLAQSIVEVSRVVGSTETDALIVLGDRIETMAAALVAHSKAIPIVHIHGGERTKSLIDDGYRDAITKLASVHFASTEEHANNIIQMGENRRRIFNVGALAVEAVTSTPVISDQEFLTRVGLPSQNLILATFHPVTLLSDSGQLELEAMLAALRQFPSMNICITGSNLDGAVCEFRERVESFVQESPKTRVLIPSLGSSLYINALRRATVCLGNSSSGLIEAPIVGIPSIDIGQRQQGRFKPKSVIHTEATVNGIAEAVNRVILQSEHAAFREVAGDYGDGSTSLKIVAVIKEMWNSGTLHKWGD